MNGTTHTVVVAVDKVTEKGSVRTLDAGLSASPFIRLTFSGIAMAEQWGAAPLRAFLSRHWWRRGNGAVCVP